MTDVVWLADHATEGRVVYSPARRSRRRPNPTPAGGAPHCPACGNPRSVREVDFANHKGDPVLHYAVVFLIIALIAAVFGFGGIAAGAAGIAKILFVVFLIGAVVSFLMHGRSRV